MNFDFAADVRRSCSLLLYGVVAFAGRRSACCCCSLDRRCPSAARTAGMVAGLPVPRRRCCCSHRPGRPGDPHHRCCPSWTPTAATGSAWTTTRWMFTQDPRSVRGAAQHRCSGWCWCRCVATAVGLIYAVLVDRARFEAVAKSLIFMPMAISFVGAGIIWKFVYAYRGDGRRADRPAQPDRGLARRHAAAVAARTAAEHAVPDRRAWSGSRPASRWWCSPPRSRRSRPTSSRPPGSTASTPWQMFWQVTLPSIRPALVVVVVTISIAHAEGLRHRPHHDRRQLRHQRDRQRDVQPGVPATTRRARAPRWRCSCSPGHPDRDLPDPHAAPAAGGAAMTHHAPPTVAAGAEPERAGHRGRPGPQAAHQPDRQRSCRSSSRCCGRADLRAVHLLVPAGGRDQDHRLVDVLHRPAVHPGQLPGGAVRHAPPSSGQLASYFINSLVITIPSVLFPLAFAALAAYALAWIKFRGRDWIYIGDLRAADRAAADGAGAAAAASSPRASRSAASSCCPPGTWRRRASSSRSGSRTPASRCRWPSSCCTTSCRELPGDLIEAARVDGASHAEDLPHDRAAADRPGAGRRSAIFQFLWVWNDLLVALIFAGGTGRPRR